MTVIHLSKPSKIINNCLTVVGLPPTGPSVSPDYTLGFPFCLANEEETARITGVLDYRYDNTFDNNYFCCSPIDGGDA
jgi:hypothetical protein